MFLMSWSSEARACTEMADFRGRTGLHGVQRSGVRDRQLVHVMLEFPVGIKLHSAHDPDHGGGIGAAGVAPARAR